MGIYTTNRDSPKLTALDVGSTAMLSQLFSLAGVKKGLLLAATGRDGTLLLNRCDSRDDRGGGEVANHYKIAVRQCSIYAMKHWIVLVVYILILICNTHCFHRILENIH